MALQYIARTFRRLIGGDWYLCRNRLSKTTTWMRRRPNCGYWIVEREEHYSWGLLNRD